MAVLSPYFPYPLAHGGAVRIYNLLREMAREFDVELFAFTDSDAEPEAAPLLEFCARVVLVRKPRYREPRWSTLLPPEVHEFRSPAMRQRTCRREAPRFGFELLQVEYTQLAEYGGDVLVEHDVTFDLFAQVRRRERTLAAWWDWFRWRRFETRAVRAVPPRGGDVGRRTRSCSARRRRPWRSRTAWTWIASARSRNRPASACCSSAPSATFPTWRPTASSPNRSGRCCATSFRK